MSLDKWYKEAKSNDLFFEIAKGNIANHFSINKFGEKPALTTTLATIWDGAGSIYSYMPSASKLTLSSGSTADTILGTGAKSVRISGIDDSWNYVSETIELNGQTPVSSINIYNRIFRIVVLSCGSGGTSAGIIYAGTGTVSTGIPANIYAQIVVGNNQTQMTILTIPQGYTGYIIDFNGSVGVGKEAVFSLAARAFESNCWLVKAKLIVTANNVERRTKVPNPIPEKTDIEIRGILGSTPAIAATASFDIVLVKNNNNVPDIIT